MDMKRNGAGRQLIPVEVDDAGATASVMAVFDDVQQVLRVPFVDQLWRVLAHFPELLPRAWERLAGALGSFEAEQAGDALRRVAVIPLALWLPSHKAFRGDMSRAEIGSDDRERISNFTSAMHYVLPKLLVAAALLEDALQPGDPAASSTRDEFRPLPRGIAPGAPQVRPIDPDHARGQAIELFAEIRKSHGYPALSDYYRSIVMAGDFLRPRLECAASDRRRPGLLRPCERGDGTSARHRPPVPPGEGETACHARHFRPSRAAGNGEVLPGAVAARDARRSDDRQGAYGRPGRGGV